MVKRREQTQEIDPVQRVLNDESRTMRRLIDLHVDWPLQYAGETTLFDPAMYADVADRLSQADGYLGATAAAVVALYRREEDWASQADPWSALTALLARVESEFPGRLLVGPEDLQRWRDDPEGLTWAMVGVEGFDPLIREPADLDRLGELFRRGVRVFQPAYGGSSALGGAAVPGDDRGVTDLGRAFLRVLAELDEQDGPRPLLDLAHLNPRAMSDALDWFEADGERPRRLLPIYSHGATVHDGYVTPRAIAPSNLARLRALGGTVGFGVSPPFFETAEELRVEIERAAEVPFLGRPGFEGLAIGTDFLGVRTTLPGLGHAEGVVDWIGATFEPSAAEALIAGNARALINRALGE
jgi:membrane dipeptidase